MTGAAHHLPHDPDELHALLLQAQQMLAEERASAQSQIAELEARLQRRDLEIQHLQLQLIKLKRMQFGRSSEKLAQEIDQLELRLEELETAQAVEAPRVEIPATERRQPVRRPLPAQLPRETVTHTAPCACPECGGELTPMGTEVSEELEYVPARFKVIRHERDTFACRGCDTVITAPMAARPVEGGLAGPGLLAHVLVSKYVDHLPLYRQSLMFEREDIDLARSTLAGWVGQVARLLEPLGEALGRHVKAGDKLHADDTPVPVLRPGRCKTGTGRFWTYVRDDRPAGEDTPPAVWFRYSPDRKGEHPRRHLQDFGGYLQADGYAGFHHLYQGGKIREVACWAHVRRKFYDIAEATDSPVAHEALQRIGNLYAIEREIRGQPPGTRCEVRRARAGPLLNEFKQWTNNTLAKLSKKSALAEAIRYVLPRWPALTRYVDNGLLEIDNNAAERALRVVALGRKNYLFAGSDAGGERAALIYSLLGTAKLNGINPQAYLAEVLTRIADHPINRIDELLPWSLTLPASA